MKHDVLLRFGLAAILAGSAQAHHGWSGYDDSKTLKLTGVVRDSGYDNPHAFVDVQVDEGKGKTWHAVLAPPSRMQARGITKEAIKPGSTVTVVGFQDKAKPNEAKIEQIIIAGKTYEIRR
jgi:hypothetical protein